MPALLHAPSATPHTPSHADVLTALLPCVAWCSLSLTGVPKELSDRKKEFGIGDMDLWHVRVSSEQYTALFRAEELVYLTADSTNVVETLDMSKVSCSLRLLWLVARVAHVHATPCRCTSSVVLWTRTGTRACHWNVQRRMASLQDDCLSTSMSV